MIKLNKYFQQIVLACKGWNSEKYSVPYTINRILSQYLGVKIYYVDDSIVYGILLKIARIVSPDEVDKIFDKMFDNSCRVISEDINKKLIGVIAATIVSDDSGDLIELIYDEDIMIGVVE